MPVLILLEAIVLILHHSLKPVFEHSINCFRKDKNNAPQLLSLNVHIDVRLKYSIKRPRLSIFETDFFLYQNIRSSNKSLKKFGLEVVHDGGGGGKDEHPLDVFNTPPPPDAISTSH